MSLKIRLLLLFTMVAAVVIMAVASLKNRPPALRVTQNDPATGARDDVENVRTSPQIANESKPKEHLTASASGNYLIYHAPFDPYKLSPEPLVFIVVDKKTGMKSLQIPVQWPARYVSSVQWLDDRFVVVRGEGAFLAILDVGSGKQTHNLVGSEFQVSPDETMIIYRSDFNPIRGYVPPERKSDCVLLTLVQRTPGSGSVNTNYKVIYPDPLSWGEDDLKIYSDFNQRHQIRSGLVWSIDNQMIAFVENNQQRLWLTVLKLESLNDAAGVNPRRFDLGPASEARFAVSWSEKMRVKIVGENTSLLVDLTSGTVTSLP